MMEKKIFETVEDAVKELKLDRRRRWFEFLGNVVYSQNYTTSCAGCSCDCSDGYGCSHGNAGCSECGYHGKVRSSCPIPACWPDGEIVEVLTNNSESV